MLLWTFSLNEWTNSLLCVVLLLFFSSYDQAISLWWTLAFNGLLLCSTTFKASHKLPTHPYDPSYVYIVVALVTLVHYYEGMSTCLDDNIMKWLITTCWELILHLDSMLDTCVSMFLKVRVDYGLISFFWLIWPMQQWWMTFWFLI